MALEERSRVTTFIDQIMQDEYGCHAHELPEVTFVALRDDALVGAIALSFEVEAPLPIEKIYELDHSTFSVPFVRSRTAQFGRWVATVPDLSAGLFYAAVEYALAHGQEWGIGEMKPKVLRRFARMGISLKVLDGKPILSRIAPEVRPYYLVSPAPVPCVMDLSNARRVLRKKVVSLVNAGVIKIL